MQIEKLMKNINLILGLILLTSFNLDAQVSYTVTVPSGTKDCFISGEMNGWVPHEMTKVSDTQYTIQIDGTSTVQQYKYCSGPSLINYVEKNSNGYNITNRTYQSNDVVQRWTAVWTPGAATAIAVGSGTVNSYFFRSKLVDSRNIEIWLPDGYNLNKKYAVLYMHDGQMLFNPAITWNQQAWMVADTLGKLLGKGLIQNTIVVGIDNNGNKREAEYFPQAVVSAIPDPEKTDLLNLMSGGPEADNYLKFIVTELKPYIDQNYPVFTDQKHTFIGGSSLGGLISLYALCSYPDVFSDIFCMSTHWIGTFYKNTQIPSAIINYLDKNLPAPAGHKIYFDHGTAGLDSMYSDAQLRIDSLMAAKGYAGADYKSLVFPGGDHNENSWKARFRFPALFVLSDSIPATVNELKRPDGFVVYPNPFQNHLFVAKSDWIGKNYKIIDVEGKWVVCNQLSDNKIDTSFLNPGIYFVCIDNKVIKIIKE